MRNVLRHARRILTMDANDAIEMASLWYVRLFRRHLLLMHVVHISVALALWFVMWRMAGTTVLWLFGAWLFLSFGLAAAAWIRRQRSP